MRRATMNLKIYLLLAGAILTGLIASLFAVEHRGYARGKQEAESAYAQRALVAEETVRTLERQSATDMVAIEEEHEQELADVTHRKDRVISDLRAGNLRLRQPDTRGGSAPSASGPATAAGAPAGLPRPDAEFLIGFAAEADAVTADRAALQEIVRKDREICR